MPVQNFTINTRDSIVGNLYGISYTNSVRHTYSNKKAAAGLAPDIAFGLAVAQSDEDRWCVLGTNVATATPAVILGLSVRQINREPDARPSAGNISFHDNEELTVLRDGFMTVLAKEAVAVGGRVWVDNVTGEFYGAVDGTNRTLALNMRWASSVSGSANAVVEISSAIMFEAA
jgi:hypothetical protein